MELNKDLNLTIQQKERILEKIRTDTQGRNSFKNFLAKEFADENLLFVEAVEKFDSSPQDERYNHHNHNNNNHNKKEDCFSSFFRG